MGSEGSSCWPFGLSAPPSHVVKFVFCPHGPNHGDVHYTKKVQKFLLAIFKANGFYNRTFVFSFLILTYMAVPSATRYWLNNSNVPRG